MLTPKSDRSAKTGQTGSPNRSDRSDQSALKENWTSPLRSSRRGDQDSYMDHPNRSPDDVDMPF